MPRKQNILGAHMSPLASDAIVGIFAGGLTATGSTQGTALALPACNNVFSTVAASTGAILPAISTMSLGDVVTVVNQGANSLSVYPNTGANINGGSANAALALAANKKADYMVVSSTGWATVVSA